MAYAVPLAAVWRVSTDEQLLCSEYCTVMLSNHKTPGES